MPDNDCFAAIREGNLILYKAAKNSTPDIVNRLLAIYPKDDRAAAVKMKNSDGDTMLHIAASRNNFDTFIIFLNEHGANNRHSAICEKNNSGNTVLFEAVSSRVTNRLEIIAVLLAIYPDANSREAAIMENDRNGNTVLHHCTWHKEFQPLYNVLLDNLSDRARINFIRRKNKYNKTAIHEAATFARWKFCSLLLLSLPIENRLLALQEKNAECQNVFYFFFFFVVNDYNGLRDLLLSLASDDLIVALKEINQYGESILKFIYSSFRGQDFSKKVLSIILQSHDEDVFKMALSLYSENDILTAINQMPIENFVFLKFANMTDKKFISDAILLQYEGLSNENFLSLLNENNEKINNCLSLAVQLERWELAKKNIEKYPPNKRLAALEQTVHYETPALSQIEKDASWDVAFGFIKAIPRDALFASLQEGGCVSDLVTNFGHDSNVKKYKDILSLFSVDKRLLVVNVRTRADYTVLNRLAKYGASAEELISVLTCLPDEDRFSAIEASSLVSVLCGISNKLRLIKFMPMDRRFAAFKKEFVCNNGVLNVTYDSFGENELPFFDACKLLCSLEIGKSFLRKGYSFAHYERCVADFKLDDLSFLTQGILHDQHHFVHKVLLSVAQAERQPVFILSKNNYQTIIAKLNSYSDSDLNRLFALLEFHKSADEGLLKALSGIAYRLSHEALANVKEKIVASCNNQSMSIPAWMHKAEIATVSTLLRGYHGTGVVASAEIKQLRKFVDTVQKNGAREVARHELAANMSSFFAGSYRRKCFENNDINGLDEERYATDRVLADISKALH